MAGPKRLRARHATARHATARLGERAKPICTLGVEGIVDPLHRLRDLSLSVRALVDRADALAAVALSVVVGSVGCSRGWAAEEPPIVTSTKSPPVTTGCGNSQSSPDPGYVTLEVAGVKRRVYVVPPNQTAEPVSVIVGFHGRGNSGEKVATRWQLAEGHEGTVLGLYPDGLPQPWFRNYVGWDTRSELSPELQLYDAMIAWAKAHYCVNPQRIHVVGHSWGGGMANLVACMRSEIRSLVSVAGGGPTIPCRGSVGAMIIHGTFDRDEPISSGYDNAASWVFYNGCGLKREPTLDGACEAYQQCAPGYPVVLCEHPGHHEWPGALRGEALFRWLERE